MVNRRKRFDMADRNEQIRRAVSVLEQNMSIVLRTAETASFRDGLSQAVGRSPLADDEDGDVVFNRVESAALLATDGQQHEVDQALAVIHMQRLAGDLLNRASEFTQRLAHRNPEEKQLASVTCVEWGCERLKADGWDARHPNGSAGRCRSCYEHRNKVRRDG